jgi:hypothetical protein
VLRDSLPNILRIPYFPANRFATPPAALADATFSSPLTLGFQIFTWQALDFTKIDATGLRSIGYAYNQAAFDISPFTGGLRDSLIFPASVNRVVSDARFFFPMSIGANGNYQSNDTTRFLLTVGAFGLNRTAGMRVFTRIHRDSIVGWGTLRMRNPSGGNAINVAVLLKKSFTSSRDSFFLGSAPAPVALLQVFGLTQGATNRTTDTYEFLGLGFKEAFLFLSVNGNAVTPISLI